jgi:hypothetical protein
MHPSFGIEYQCPSLKWEDVMKGPSREAVLAHTFKVLHYRELFGAPDATVRDNAHDSPALALDQAMDFPTPPARSQPPVRNRRFSWQENDSWLRVVLHQDRSPALTEGNRTMAPSERGIG